MHSPFMDLALEAKIAKSDERSMNWKLDGLILSIHTMLFDLMSVMINPARAALSSASSNLNPIPRAKASRSSIVLSPSTDLMTSLSVMPIRIT